MKFDSKSLVFEIIWKTHQETFLCHSHWLNPQEGRSRFLLKNPKNMNHNYYVINLCFNETRQKVFAHHHSELGENNLVLSEYSICFDKSPEFFYFGCHRTLSEGQEIASKSEFSAQDHSGSVSRQSSIFDEITQSWVTERFFIFILVINWWVTWYGQKYFHISYCHNVEERNQR